MQDKANLSWQACHDVPVKAVARARPPIVRNKANSETTRSCQTKPICRAYCPGIRRGVRNKANSKADR